MLTNFKYNIEINVCCEHTKNTDVMLIYLYYKNGKSLTSNRRI